MFTYKQDWCRYSVVWAVGISVVPEFLTLNDPLKWLSILEQAERGWGYYIHVCLHVCEHFHGGVTTYICLKNFNHFKLKLKEQVFNKVMYSSTNCVSPVYTNSYIHIL